MTTLAAPALRRSTPVRVRGGRWLPAAVLLLFAVVQQSAGALDCDVSWLIGLGERMLGGARLYRDVFEVNPPASILAYLPGVWLADRIAVPPEAVVATGTFAAAFGMLVAAGRLLDVRRGDAPGLAAAGVFALLVLPGYCFAQREHLALILLVPALAIGIRRADGKGAPLWVAIAAGLGEGACIAIKPHFALAVLAVALVVAWRRRSMREMFAAEHLAGAIVALGYVALVARLFPDYARMLPLLGRTYLPARAPWRDLLLGPVLVQPAILSVVTLWVARRPLPTAAVVALGAGGGFALAGLLQAKGYMNHAYGGIALGWLALAIVVRGAERERSTVGAIALVVMGLTQWHGFVGIANRAALEPAIARIAPPHPRLIALSTDFGLGHPLDRHLGARWVGRWPALIVTGNADYIASLPGTPVAARAALARDADADARTFLEDLERGRPDIVLDDASLGPDWRRAHPAIMRALAAYVPAASCDGVTILVRSGR